MAPTGTSLKPPSDEDNWRKGDDPADETSSRTRTSTSTLRAEWIICLGTTLVDEPQIGGGLWRIGGVGKEDSHVAV